MTFFTIPVSNQLPWQKFRITLSGAIYSLEFRYNTRMQRWIMSISDSSDSPVLMGIPVLIERNMSGQYTYLKIPAGVFFATDDTGQGAQPTQFSFGVSHTQWYEDPTQ